MREWEGDCGDRDMSCGVADRHGRIRPGASREVVAGSTDHLGTATLALAGISV
jgi:hypothetical protein